MDAGEGAVRRIPTAPPNEWLPMSNEIVNDARDVVDSAETFIKR